MASLCTKNTKNSRNMREKYSFMSIAMKYKVIPPSGLQKSGKTLGKASGFTAFCNPRVESPYISLLLMKESYIIT